MTEIETPGYQLIADDETVWMQANRVFGNMVPNLSSDGEGNRNRALGVIGQYTTASQVARMRSTGADTFLDLDRAEPLPIQVAQGLITTNPNVILHANAADCGEIGLHGFSAARGAGVIALLHASRGVVGDGIHLRAIEYMFDELDVDPETVTARVAPSARVESYVFPDIDKSQKNSDFWRDYVYQDKEGLWHVDFHQRSIDDMLGMGILKENMIISDVDTIADHNYFSNYREARGERPIGRNGTLYALRTPPQQE